ncbi:hypothetical protein COY93_00620 [Candidatus Uhrbacteria bacterium CG_4_10_14_0_8_um_filter_58_22]|uniref:DUF8128 domain-containing protein n=1 Tax=Candidatus Uhrbacteria bacterium CG_4_10_14_0_8_um_filter_58_22 TaxID=1975029 RepID=A0A2M7QBQ0_9BACT|nr:MAG: hypothetical protein AUJ19_04165 [Parcubacteria group bacterium CG1_02_58_44]PIY63290.1 MAG: hypothetical protein COY93_00620 [Candidatus Uhrbacteria bacterium CG_4_10_14_0_8_um_filter_58_22]
MPTLNVDFGYFFEIGNLSFPQMLLRLFLDGGWIPVLLVLAKGCWMLWVQWRQNKFDRTITTCVLAIDVPRQNEQTAKAAEQIFSTITGAYSGLDSFEKYWLGKCQPIFSFEIVSVNGYVQFLVHVWTKFRDLVESAVYAQYPDAEIVEIADYTGSVPSRYPDPEWDVFGSEFVLKKPSHLPLRTYPQFEHTSAEFPFKDPISALLEVMGSLRNGEQLWVQFLIRPNDNKWRDKGIKEIEKMLGRKPSAKKSILDDALWLPKGVVKEIGSVMSSSNSEKGDKKDDPLKMLAMSPGERGVVEAAQMKMTKIGFDSKIRVVYAARRDIFSKKHFVSVKGTFMQYASLNLNELKPFGKVTPRGDYFYQRWSEQGKKVKLLSRYRGRSMGAGAPPYVLNIEELATMYHFPMLDQKTPLLKKTAAKRAEPPSSLPTVGEVQSDFFKPIKKAAKEEENGRTGTMPGNLPLA